MKTRSLLNQDYFTEVISVCFIEGNFVSMYQSSWISSDPLPHFIACSCKLNCTCNQRDNWEIHSSAVLTPLSFAE